MCKANHIHTLPVHCGNKTTHTICAHVVLCVHTTALQALIWFDLIWIELNWIELNWIELNWILNWFDLIWFDQSIHGQDHIYLGEHGRNGITTSKLFIFHLSEKRECRNWKGDLVIVIVIEMRWDEMRWDEMRWDEMRERERERLDAYTVCVCMCVCVWWTSSFYSIPPPAQQSLPIREIIERNGGRKGGNNK